MSVLPNKRQALFLLPTQLSPCTCHPTYSHIPTLVEDAVSARVRCQPLCVQIYGELRRRIIAAQPADRQAHLAACLDKLMADVQRTLEPKNRDKFTQVLLRGKATKRRSFAHAPHSRACQIVTVSWCCFVAGKTFLLHDRLNRNHEPTLQTQACAVVWFRTSCRILIGNTHQTLHGGWSSWSSLQPGDMPRAEFDGRAARVSDEGVGAPTRHGLPVSALGSGPGACGCQGHRALRLNPIRAGHT